MTAIVALLVLGLVSGLVIAALGHPKIYHAVFRKSKRKTLDW